MKLALISFTSKGACLNAKLLKALTTLDSSKSLEKPKTLQESKRGVDKADYVWDAEGYHLSRYEGKDLVQVNTSLKEWTKKAFDTYEGIIYIGATGIAVRAIAPFIKSKDKDPAIIVVDELGQHIIPLLSGHLGGANKLARSLSELTKGKAIISTATDLEGCFAVDEWAKEHNMVLKELKTAKVLSAALLQGETIGISSSFPIKGELPQGIVKVQGGTVLTKREGTEGGTVLSKREGIEEGKVLSKGLFVGLNDLEEPFEETLHLMPRVLVLGIGCKKGTSFEKINNLVQKCLKALNLSLDAVRQVCSIDLKKEEEGLIAWAKMYDKPICFYSSEVLNAVEGTFTSSSFVKSVTNVDNVCERAAIKGSNGGNLILKKTVLEGVTLAIAQSPFEVILTYK